MPKCEAPGAIIFSGELVSYGTRPGTVPKRDDGSVIREESSDESSESPRLKGARPTGQKLENPSRYLPVLVDVVSTRIIAVCPAACVPRTRCGVRIISSVA